MHWLMGIIVFYAGVIVGVVVCALARAAGD
jgi:hypothetical protein